MKVTDEIIYEMNRQINESRNDLAALRAENAKLREALNSVCDKSVYALGGGYVGMMKRDQAAKIALDAIKQARAALA